VAGGPAACSGPCCASSASCSSRSVGQAFDELAALVSLYGSPVRSAPPGVTRSASGRPHEHDVRGLLAPWWLPYRHGLDVVSDLAPP
jgi:hypothetical protein